MTKPAQKSRVEWKYVETYVLCDLDLLVLPIVGPW